MKRTKSGYRVLIPDGDYPHTLAVIRCLGTTGAVKTHVGTPRPDGKVRYSRYTSGLHQLPDIRDEDWTHRVARLAEATQADVVLPVSESGTLRLARDRAHVENFCPVAPVPDESAFNTAVDKGSLAALVRKLGLPGLNTWEADAMAGGLALPPEIEFPVVVKATRGAFGREVYLAHAPAELTDILSRLSCDARRYIVQEFVEGHDVDCSVLCRDGMILAYTIQRERIPAPPGTFQPPIVIEFEQDEAVLDIVKSLMQALGWTGVAHIDLRRDARDGKPRILEINARFWGSILGSLHAGVNMPHLACLTGLGIAFPAPRVRSGVFFTRGITGRAAADPSVRYHWRQSNLPFVLRDPFPELMGRLTSFGRA